MIKPPIFDVSGIHGASGNSGMSSSHLYSEYNYKSKVGGDGTNGQCGTSAGTITVRLTTPTTTADVPKNVVLPNPISADVKVDASIVCTAGRLQKLDAVLKIMPEKLMCFLAPGGDGGAGGDGGDGENGRLKDWYDRLLSYEVSPDGGDGGNAGNGCDGGSGGIIRIFAPKGDTYLFVLCGTIKYSGGRGGSAGTPGKGGKSF
jgi:hypothetical protein